MAFIPHSAFRIPHLVWVVGTASLDVLHLPGPVTTQAAGGAGLYTALAAYWAGAAVSLWAPRPDPMPEPLQPVAGRVTWAGPTISPEALPRLEIEHHGGGQATLLQASWGAELQLVPDRLPTECHRATIVHIAALSTAQRQLDFLQVLGSGPDSTQTPRLSVGTYARLVQGETENVRQLVDQADLFFMNENEAVGLFGRVDQAHTRPDALLFVTLGANGVLVIKGKDMTHIPGHAATEVDPTGAGDTFCGATLAGLARGESPVAAAQYAVKVAAGTVSAVGPAALLDGE